MFETLLLAELKKRRKRWVTVESAGLMSGCDMLTITDKARAVLEEVGLTPASYRSRHISKVDENQPIDLILCMDEGQRNDLVVYYNFKPEIVRVLNAEAGGVADPTYTGDFGEHRSCRDLLAHQATLVVNQLPRCHRVRQKRPQVNPLPT